MTKVRCAIYTRKSSEEGLEQDFNSLDAQREACAAYVLSQASEGWTLLPEQYDDGGLSGGTLERPALQRLLDDIALGRIDIIVVYKVDRLTRSLIDFAKLVEAFDAHEVSFVSVTQSFNTTTSMGRLTLNMLLSFAQFEREVTAERIRDKIAASKAKGMWMGGVPPLGYQPDGRSLSIVHDHAAIIRDIYQRYRKLGNVRKVAEELSKSDIRQPTRTFTTGRTFGGGSFSRGQLYSILRNPIYVGDIPHKGQIHPGNHIAVIDRVLWDEVQKQLEDNRQGLRQATHRNQSLLAGLLFDDQGAQLQAVHSTKGRKRYRYYIGKPNDNQPALRLPACEIEQLVRQELAKLLADPVGLLAKAEIELVPTLVVQIEATTKAISPRLARGGTEIIRELIDRVTIHPKKLVIAISRSGLARIFGLPNAPEHISAFDHEISACLKRSGMAVRLVRHDGVPAIQPKPNTALIKLIVKGQRWWSRLAQGDIDVARLASQEGVTGSYISRVVRLAFLSPRVVDAILAGQVRAEVDAKALVATGAVDLSWEIQQAKILPDTALNSRQMN